MMPVSSSTARASLRSSRTYRSSHAGPRSSIYRFTGRKAVREARDRSSSMKLALSSAVIVLPRGPHLAAPPVVDSRIFTSAPVFRKSISARSGWLVTRSSNTASMTVSGRTLLMLVRACLGSSDFMAPMTAS